MTDEPDIPKKRSIWQRWIVDPLVRQLAQGITPAKISLSISLGSALALFPILGTTTTLCFLAGVALRLNQAVIQGVNALCTFAYFPLMVAFIRLGERISGGARTTVDIPAMITLVRQHPAQFFRDFGATALHAILGWAVVAPFWIPLVYLALLPVLRAMARKRQEAAS
jgi:uncharacterized protein (DUF2062 family)